MNEYLGFVPATVTVEPRYQQQSFTSFTLGTDPRMMPVWDLDGVAWLDADPPPRWHKHWPQTVGILTGARETWRCPCGAHGGPLERWILLDKQRVAPSWIRRLLVSVATARND